MQKGNCNRLSKIAFLSASHLPLQNNPAQISMVYWLSLPACAAHMPGKQPVAIPYISSSALKMNGRSQTQQYSKHRLPALLQLASAGLSLTFCVQGIGAAFCHKP